MAETIEFWVNVTGENAMQRNEVGFKSAVRVRLVHAIARSAIEQSGTWKNEDWGLPINQQDMIATNIGFSLVFIEGLKRLGYRPSQYETEGVLHLWKYIGFLLGIPPAYLPDTEKEAIEILYKWTITQSGADDDTIALARALALEPELATYPRFGWQKKLLIKVHLGYNYFFLGDRACKTMQLPRSWYRYFPYSVRFFKRLAESHLHRRPRAYKKAVTWGRNYQVKIKKAFLRGHAQLTR
jgi:hypothetical protein